MKTMFIKNISTLIILFVFSYSYAQEVWFNWLNHLNNIQEEWIDIEKETFGIWNNISRFQDFDGLAKRTKSLNASIQKMRTIHDNEKVRYGKKYPEIFNLSTQYLTSLEETIEYLEIILHRLDDKTNDINSYLWDEYSNDVKNYQKSVENYHTLGKKMNVEFNKIQSMQ